MGLLSTRAAALAAGHKNYFTGKPCKAGHISERDAKSGKCPDCTKEYAERWSISNKERIAEHNRTYRSKHAEAKRVRDAEYRAKNPERIAAYLKEYGPKWRCENPLKVIASAANARAKFLGCIGRISEADILDARLTAGDACVICRSTETLEVDHVIALANGGENTRANIQILCRPCNRRKSKNDDAAFKQRAA